jgi:hypothetical protein
MRCDKEFDIYLVGLGQTMVLGTQNNKQYPNMLQICSKLRNPETLERKIVMLNVRDAMHFLGFNGAQLLIFCIRSQHHFSVNFLATMIS